MRTTILTVDRPSVEMFHRVDVLLLFYASEGGILLDGSEGDIPDWAHFKSDHGRFFIEEILS